MFKALVFAGAAVAAVSADDSAVTPSIQVTCQPKAVALNTPFFVNIKYDALFKRTVDVHVDLLNAATNTWQAGSKVTIKGAEGNVTARVMVPQEAQEPFKWNVFLTPAGETWPNVLASTSFEANMGAKVADACAPQKNAAFTPKEGPAINYVYLKRFPTDFKAGQTQVVVVDYKKLTEEKAQLVVGLIRASDNTPIAQTKVTAEKGHHVVKLPFTLPADAVTEPVYLEATIVPEGKTWTERIADDRIYNTFINAERHLRGSN